MIEKKDVLDYEIAQLWWIPLVRWIPGSAKVVGGYLGFKARLKYERYLRAGVKTHLDRWMRP